MSFIIKLINVFDLYTERKIFLKLNELLGKDINQSEYGKYLINLLK